MNPDLTIDGNAAMQYIRDCHLRKIFQSDDGWTIRYIDDPTGDELELTYPHGEWHGGGPPRLERIKRREKPVQ